MIDGDGDGGKHTRKRKYQARKVHDRASCIRIKVLIPPNQVLIN